jgi:hypothetical protein
LFFLINGQKNIVVANKLQLLDLGCNRSEFGQFLKLSDFGHRNPVLPLRTPKALSLMKSSKIFVLWSNDDVTFPIGNAIFALIKKNNHSIN